MDDIKDTKRFWDVDKLETAMYKRVDSIVNPLVWSEDYITKMIKEDITFGKDISNKSILDFGCGVGRILKYMSKFSNNIHGIDISDKMIQHAKEYINNKNVTLKSYDGVKIPYSNNEFDIIYSFHVFQHIPKRYLIINYLNEIKRVLKKDGYVIIHFIGKYNNQDQEPGSFSGYRPDQENVKKICEEAGLVIKEIKQEKAGAYILQLSQERV